MKAKQRIEEAHELYKEANTLYDQIKNSTDEKDIQKYRLQLATLEKQISLIRMFQAEKIGVRHHSMHFLSSTLIFFFPLPLINIMLLL